MRRSGLKRLGMRGVAAVTALGLALPLAGCAAAAAEEASHPVDLARSGCPANIRIHTDDAPGVKWGFLYSLLDPTKIQIFNNNSVVRAPLIVDGEPTGVSLTILTGDPTDGQSANVALHEDRDLLLAAVDSDQAI